MKVVQAAILVVVGALAAVLFMNWHKGREQKPAPVAQVNMPSTPAPVEPAPAPAATPEPPKPESKAEPAKPEPKPKTARKPSIATKKAQPITSAPSPPWTDAPAQTASNTQPATPPPQPAVETPKAVEPPPPPPPPPPPRQVTLKAGTLLPVRLIETVSSDRNKPGDTFTASLDEELVVDGLVIAERGARFEGRVVETEQAGRVKGLGSIAIELTEMVTSDGQRIQIVTDPFTKSGPASKGSDAAKIGGAAAIGAAIGAIAGGGKGAGIGAAIGGAAGAGGVAATRGKPAVLSSETKISFRLRDAVSITERRRK